MKPDVKKLVILNLPYLFFVYLFGKCGQAYRLAAGADLSGKLLHLADGFTAAFANPLPSLQLFDFCVGVAGALIVRLVVCCKGKNCCGVIFQSQQHRNIPRQAAQDDTCRQFVFICV